jgi:uncharacterized protein
LDSNDSVHQKLPLEARFKVMGEQYSFFPATRIILTEDGTRIVPNLTRQKHHEPGSELTVNLTTACNLRCKYCYQEQYDNRSLSLQHVQRALKQFSEVTILPLVSIHFFGGEPLLEFPLMKEIISLCKCKYPGLTFSVVTNGTLLDKDIATFFKTNGINVIVSWDGYGGYRVDSKGRDSSKQVLTNILEAAPILKDKLWVRFTVTPDVKDLVGPICDLSKAQIRQIIVKDVSYEGNNIVRAEIKRQKELYRDLAVYYLKEHQQGRSFLLCARGVGFSTILDDLSITNHRKLGCQGGISKITLTADGDYIPCPRYSKIKSITLGSISVGLKEKYYKPFQAKCCPPACETCFAKPICGGPCHPDSDHKPPDCDICKLIRYRTSLAVWLKHQMLENKLLHLNLT